jgi:Kef-type K+ transport system membrane component KefB
MSTAVVFGLVVSFLAIISKVAGCGIPALGVGFNPRGGWRIGIGMLPRGEVALIIAGVGLAEGIIGPALFGVSIMMTIITTLLAPMFLVPAFQAGGSGLRSEDGNVPGPAE